MKRPTPISDTAVEVEQGDVVVVPFPYADRLVEKKRPAVVVSGKPLLEKRLVWLAMVTSADNAGWPCDIAIDDLADTGLRAPSIIRPWKLATVDASRIVRVAGRIAPEVLSRLKNEIASVLRAEA